MTIRSARLLLLAFLLPLAACDETSSFSATPQDAIEDAAAARNSGDFDGAVAILERALAENPDNAPVRVELSSTLIARADIDLLDVDRIATYLSESAGNGVAAPAASAAKGGCAFETDPGAVAFDPTDAPNFPEVEASRPDLEAAIELLQGLIPDALRPGTTDAAFCGSIDTSQTPVAFDYDAEAAAAELRAALTASGYPASEADALIGQLLADYALLRFSLAYLDVSEGLQQQTTWYRLSDGSIGICADDPEALEDDARTAIADVLEALFSLDLRASTFSEGAAASDILESVTAAFEDVRDGFGDYCAAI